jgi:GDP-L-fucose synthase
MIHRFSEARATGAASVTLWGDGTPTRDFLHVEDAARAFRLALERHDASEAINIGSGEELSINDLATLVAETVGFRGAVLWDKSYPNGQPRRVLDTTMAAERLGFVASVPLRSGIAQMASWYEEARTFEASHRHL